MFERLKKIDRATKYAIYGWIRKTEKELNFKYIPIVISNICILFFAENVYNEIFDNLRIGKNVKLTKNNKCIEITKFGCDNTTNVFGNISIFSLNNIKCKWELNIVGKCCQYFIGISSGFDIIDFNKPIYEQMHNGEGHHYIYYSFGNTPIMFLNRCVIWKWYGWRYGDHNNDKLTIDLNMKKGELKYCVNEKDHGIAFNNIKKGNDIFYRLFVSYDIKDEYENTDNINGNIQIIDFTQTVIN